MCIRHRATQTLYVSDILHVPRLENPGYGKLQIGIYIAALEDALGRHRLEKMPKFKNDPPGDDDNQRPNTFDSDGADDPDDDDRNEPKSKRHKRVKIESSIRREG